jgi:hypothetical protein
MASVVEVIRHSSCCRPLREVELVTGPGLSDRGSAWSRVFVEMPRHVLSPGGEGCPQELASLERCEVNAQPVVAGIHAIEAVIARG